MPYALFITMFSVSLLTALFISYTFVPWLNRILDRLASQPLLLAWRKCLNWAIILVGLQGGVKLDMLEDFAFSQRQIPFNTNPMHWVVEIYRSFIDTAQSCIWVVVLFLLVAFVVEALIFALQRKNKKES